MRVRSYGSYSEYVLHQKSKLEQISWLPSYDQKYSQILTERLKEQQVVKAGMNVLCLGARVGSEVKAFLALGCFAVGIDLNPSKENKYVLYGDFHDIQFSSQCVDVVFTNCIDHVWSLDQFLHEVKRVLKPNGYFILEIEKGLKEGGVAGEFECFFWEKIEDMIEVLTHSGLKVVKKTDIDYPWNGQHIIFVMR